MFWRRAHSSVLLALLLAQCAPLSAPSTQPPARPALLVLDFGLASPYVHDGMLRLFSRAGYAVDHRPDYPALVRQDFRSYDAIMLLSGSTPELPGAMLNARALAPLAEFVSDGGVLLLGTPVNLSGGDAGENERTLFNALLRRLQIPILIHKGGLTDHEDHYPNTLYEAPWLYAAPRHPLTDGLPERLSLPRMAALDAGAGAAVLVSSSPTGSLGGGTPQGAPLPAVAMGRRGRGLVVVASRQFFNPTGAYQVDTPLSDDPARRLARRQLVERIAGYAMQWHGETAEWTANAAGEFEAPDATQPAFWRSSPLPRAVPGPLRAVNAMAAPAPEAGERARWLATLDRRYRWILEDGMRAGWVYVDREAPFQQAVRNLFVEGRLNLLWGSSDAELLTADDRATDQRALLEQWARMDRLLRNTGVKWFMGSHYPGAHAPLSDYPKALGAQGQTIGGMSPLDWRFWETEIFPVLAAEAEFSATHPSVAGLLIDLEMYPLGSWYFTNGFDFSDLAFDVYLRALAQREDAETLARAKVLKAEERFAWLMERGLLRDYWSVLGEEAERIGRALHERVHAVNPELLLGFYAAAIPTGWFYEGLLRGAGGAAEPALLFTFQHAPDEELDEMHRQGIHLLHAAAVLLGQVTEAGMRGALHARLARDQGYWLNNVATLATDDAAQHRRSPIEAPRDADAARYLRAIADANRAFRRGP